VVSASEAGSVSRRRGGRRRYPVKRVAQPKAKAFKSDVKAARSRPAAHDRLRKKLVPLVDGTPCPVCGAVMDDSLPVGHERKPELDHLFAHSRGGVSSLENVRVICGRCNRRKSAGPVDLPRASYIPDELAEDW
jgi:5-methylcytosine-specific restriction endonuclease McrA